MRTPAIATLLLAALLAAGCGGKAKSDQDKVASTIRTYYSAFAAGDSKKACDQLSAQTKKQLSKAGAGQGCPEILSQATQRPAYQKVVPKLKDLKIGKITVTGETATASVHVLGATTTVPLRKEGSDWKIQSPLGG